MLPVFNQKELGTNHLYPTLFGFSTRNKIASQLLNYVYGVVMVVATAFAFHALSLILSDWNKLFIFLASISVVGLPYCIKIIMFGSDSFERKHALLCLAISVLPAIFDFVGFYSETSIKQALTQTKFEIVEKISYFNTEAREKLENDKIKLIQQRDKELADLDSDFTHQTNQLDTDLAQVKQTYIDETEGVKGQATTGKPGSGPRAKEFQSEIRKTETKNQLELKKISKEKEIQAEKIKNKYEALIGQSELGLKEIDTLVSSDTKAKGLLYQVNNVSNFSDLAKITITVNNSISNISSKMSLEPKFVSFKTDDVIQLSFGALMRGEITALICFLLAFLLEMVDIIIVYMVRGVKRKEEEQPEEKKYKMFHKVYNFANEKLGKAIKSDEIERQHVYEQDKNKENPSIILTDEPNTPAKNLENQNTVSYYDP